MMQVTSAEVKAIMDNCTLTDDTVDVYILAANNFITGLFGTTQTDTTKELVRWMTAHMIASTRFRIATTEKVGEAQIEYAGKFGIGLDSTPYGQMLKQLDTTGKIVATSKLTPVMYAIPEFDDTTTT
jgi:hypothetical protein